MRRLFYFCKAALIFAKHQAWADAPAWGSADAIALASFLSTPAGIRLRAILANTIVRQQSNALTRTDNLVYEAGYCAGQKALASTISALADKTNFTEQGDTEADPATNQGAS